MNTRRKIIILFLCIAFAILAGCGQSSVKTVKPRVGTLQSSFTEMAKTRLTRTYTLTMPLSGELNKINLEAGDKIKKEQILASLKQHPLNLAIQGAQEKLNVLKKYYIAQKARQNSLTTERHYAYKQLKRKKALEVKKFISEADLDEAREDAATSHIAVIQQEHNLSAIKAAINQANAQLAQARHNLSISKIRSPITSVILNRYTQGNQWLPAGTKLFRVGNFNDLEGVADALTMQAVDVHVGDLVLLSLNGKQFQFQGRVKRIDPAGFTKRSALGVDEQRVNVIIQIINPEKMNIGVGYRLFAKFITGEQKDAIIIPRYSVLQDPQGNDFVLIMKDKKLRKQIVKLGIITDTEVSVTSGLKPNQTIVEAPSASMVEGMRG